MIGAWTMNVSGRVYGPYSADRMRTFISEGRLAPHSLITREGASDWHEARHEHGVSHFLEHMCFKGTSKRDWREINVRFDELGSIYNAFTGKEHTVYYGWVPSGQASPQLELLSDMMRPSLPSTTRHTRSALPFQHLRR